MLKIIKSERRLSCSNHCCAMTLALQWPQCLVLLALLLAMAKKKPVAPATLPETTTEQPFDGAAEKAAWEELFGEFEREEAGKTDELLEELCAIDLMRKERAATARAKRQAKAKAIADAKQRFCPDEQVQKASKRLAGGRQRKQAKLDVTLAAKEVPSAAAANAGDPDVTLATKEVPSAAAANAGDRDVTLAAKEVPSAAAENAGEVEDVDAYDQTLLSALLHPGAVFPRVEEDMMLLSKDYEASQLAGAEEPLVGVASVAVPSAAATGDYSG
jgi:hypothetical protein